MRRRLAVLAALGVLGPAGCDGGDPAEVSAGHPVTLAPVLAVDLVERIDAPGQLVAKEQASIAAEVGGRVTEVLIDEGAAVEAGDAVLSIDPERRRLERDGARARVNEERAARRDRERDYERVVELHQRRVASDTQLDQARTELDRARSRLEGAEAELGMAERALRDARVTAPFAGWVAERFVSRGEFVSPGTPLFELVALDPIEVEFSLPEVDSGRVRLGQRVEVRVAPYPDEIFEAVVSMVSPTIDPRTRTLRVQGALANRDGRLRPGLFARVDLGIQTRRGVTVIPEEAVLQRSDGPVVFRLVDGDRVERRVIETGQYSEGRVEVVRGLEVGDVIVSRGHSDLIDGERVVPRHPDGTPIEPPAPDVAARSGET